MSEKSFSFDLGRIMDEAFKGGLVFAPGQGSGPGGDHPLDNPWVNGVDPVDELERVMEVRRIALEGFSGDQEEPVHEEDGGPECDRQGGRGQEFAGDVPGKKAVNRHA